MVIPTYNEARNLAELLDLLGSVLDAALGGAYELIVVDDDSPDGTWKIAGEIAGRDSRIKVLRRTGERGLATAVVRGWQIARGESWASSMATCSTRRKLPASFGRRWRGVRTWRLRAAG